MTIVASNASSAGISVRRDVQIDEGELSPYAIAQNGLSELVSAAVHAQRVEAMHAAMLVDLIFLTVTYALHAEQAFVAPTLSPERRREMAHRSVTAELATALRMPERTMQRQIDDAWALSTQLPVTLSALRCGEISLQHARVIVEATVGLDDDPRLRDDLDRELTALAADQTAATLRRKARSIREQLQATTIAERHLAARAERRVELEPAHDGMAWLHAYLPVSDALLIRDRLDRAAVDIDDARSADQLRADLARDLLLYGTLADDSVFAAACERVRPSVHVTVPVLTLMGLSSAPAMLEGYGPIDPETARRLAARAPSFVRLLTHPVTGTVLDVDRTSYRPPADLRRWLRVRDETCRFPGCNRSAVRCELDHGIDWHCDGRTACDNLAHLCARHHNLKHETSWSLQHRPDGVLEWTSPAGRKVTTHPACIMAIEHDIGGGAGGAIGSAPLLDSPPSPLSGASPPGCPDGGRSSVPPELPPF
ncbi:DUF222 domain-containing protein [Agromyces sp. NPDC055520]